MDGERSVLECKEKGNDCVRNGNYAEAVLHYTEAIKLDPMDHTLFSNRSLAFLKLQQFYLAMEDAKQTIKLKPDWAKGYFRKGEIEYSTFHFTEALLSYKDALILQPNDTIILEAILRTTKERQKDKRADDQIPWVGAGVGIVMGVIIVIADNILTLKPTLAQPILMSLVTIAVGLIGYAFARAYRYFVKCQRSGLLEPPIDLMKDIQTNGVPCDNEDEEDGKSNKTERTHRYTKAQARQRYKKGRS